MPQPLSQFIQKSGPWNIKFDANELKKRPELAALAAEIVAKASSMDFAMGRILVHMLHASPEPAFAMFSAISDAGNKHRMIIAAARAALSPEDFELLEVAAIVYRSQIDIRNRIAHWIWGSCDQVPTGLLLVDPRYMLGHQRNLQQESMKFDIWADDRDDQAVEQRHERMVDAMTYDFSKIYVYKQNDLELILRDFDEATLIFAHMDTITNPQVRQLVDGMKSFPSSMDYVEHARTKVAELRLFSEALGRQRAKRGVC